MRVAGRGYRDGVRSLEVMVESLSGGSRPEIQEEGRVMELKNFLFKYSRWSWREANWVRLSDVGATGPKCGLKACRLWMSQ